MIITSDTQAYSGGSPALSTPDRRCPSVRRTTTHDCVRPEGFSGPVVVAARGRDLLTSADSDTEVLDAARLDVTVKYLEGVITGFTADPPHPGLQQLIGAGAFAGFRGAIEKALPGESESHSVRFQLLDELPAALLQSGRSLRAAGIGIKMEGRKLPVDICAGWAEGGSLLKGFTDFGPPFNHGPQAPPLHARDDALAWHDMEPLPPHGTRRCRRLDLWEADGRAWVECFFRDSHTNAEGSETVVHEWTLTAALDPLARCFMSGAARTGPLPYQECPGAAASATRLTGVPVDGLRRLVRNTIVGPSTCTHLNDTMRSMEDAGALLDALRQRGGCV